MTRKGKRHVLSERWPGRLICGRRKPSRVRLIEAGNALEDPELCGKCRRQVAWELRLRQLRREYRPPAGMQFEFGFMEELRWQS